MSHGRSPGEWNCLVARSLTGGSTIFYLSIKDLSLSKCHSTPTLFITRRKCIGAAYAFILLQTGDFTLGSVKTNKRVYK
jgi:hypothetical protein